MAIKRFFPGSVKPIKIETAVPGTATPAQVLAGKTYSAGTNYGAAGTMPNNGALGTITPGTAAHAIPAGYTSGGTVAGDANLVAGNILGGQSIFGVSGTGKRSASGVASSTSNTTGFTNTGGGTLTTYSIQISGLSFNPSRIVVVFNTTTYAQSVTVADTVNDLYKGSAGNTNCVLNSNTLSVNLSGPTFTLPVNYGNVSYNWYAYE